MAAHPQLTGANPGTSPEPTTETFRFRDPALRDAIKALRAAVRNDPATLRVFERVVERVKKLDRILGDWDAHHGRQAMAFLESGQPERASGAAWMLFDPDRRRAILSQIHLGIDADEIAERVAANLAAERFEEAA
jgi:hypothetical protein